MSNEEQRRMLVEILAKLAESDELDDAELSLLAFHLGIPESEFCPLPEIIERKAA